MYLNLSFYQINVIEDQEVWKGKRCSSYADPHQKTFDGKYDIFNEWHLLLKLLINRLVTACMASENSILI